MIEIWPAIDLIDSTNVRLTEGKYDSKESMNRTAEEAIKFYSQFKSVSRIHVIDLIGAKNQQPTESDYIEQLVHLTDLPIEVGGGIRTLETIDAYFDKGIEYIIVGTKGISDINWLSEIAHRYPGKIYLSVDAYAEEIKLNGWIDDAGINLFEFITQIDGLPLGGIIYTDISKDGKLSGPNFELTGRLVTSTNIPIIASGGIRSKQDIEQLERLNVHAAIVGKAANTDSFWEGIS